MSLLCWVKLPFLKVRNLNQPYCPQTLCKVRATAFLILTPTLSCFCLDLKGLCECHCVLPLTSYVYKELNHRIICLSQYEKQRCWWWDNQKVKYISLSDTALFPFWYENILAKYQKSCYWKSVLWDRCFLPIWGRPAAQQNVFGGPLFASPVQNWLKGWLIMDIIALQHGGGWISSDDKQLSTSYDGFLCGF